MDSPHARGLDSDTLILPGGYSCLADARSFIEERVSALFPGMGAGRVGEIVLAVHETLANIIEHAYGGTEGTVRVDTGRRSDGVLTVRITHRGRGFEPPDTPPPEPDVSREGGYGMHIIDRLMDDATYEDLGDGSHAVTLTARP